jgi:DNA-binding IclR family transcriptional regulator
MPPAAKSRKRKNPPEYAVPALDRGLDILEALSTSPTPLSLTDLARQLDHPPSCLFRLLTRFEKRRYVVREAESGKYALSLKLFELSHTHSPVENLMKAAAGPMRELAAQVEESVHLSVLSHARLIVLLDIGSPARVRLSIEAGSQFSPVATTSGRLLLAYLAPQELEAVLSKDEEFRALSANDREQFHKDLVVIRRKGYAVASSPERAGLKDVSVLVGNPEIGQTAALAIACWRTTKGDQAIELLRPMQECSQRITSIQGLTYDHVAIL